MPRRLLSLSPYGSYLPRSGGTRRIHFLNRGLARAGWEVFQFSFSGIGERSPFREIEVEIADGYREYRYLNPFVILTNRLLKEAGGPQIAPSFIPSLLYRSAVLDREIERADVIMIEHPHYYNVIRGRMRPDQLLVQDSHNIESTLYESSHGRLAWLAREKLIAAERALFQEADLSFTCTEADKQKAILDFGALPERVFVAPNGTDVQQQYHRVENKERKLARETLGLNESPTAIFMGSNWPPNVEAVSHILALAKCSPETNFIVAGTCGNAVRSDRPSNVHILGFVEDLSPYIAASDVALNPITSGGGSNVKVFDYLAAGLPVVSTEFGVRGVEDPSGLAIFVTELSNFGDAIARLSSSAEQGRRSEAARALAFERYDWDSIAANVSHIIDSTLRNGSAISNETPLSN